MIEVHSVGLNNLRFIEDALLKAARTKRSEILYHAALGHEMWMLEVDEKIVGLASTFTDESDRFWLDRYYVEPKYRHTKAAYSLLKTAIGEYSGFVYFYIDKDNERSGDRFYKNSTLITENDERKIYKRRF